MLEEGPRQVRQYYVSRLEMYHITLKYMEKTYFYTS